MEAIVNNKVNEYCVSYSYRTLYETEWFKAKSKKEAVQCVKAITGVDITVENVIGRPKNASMGRQR